MPLPQALRPSPAWLTALVLLVAHQVLERVLDVRIPLLDNYLDPLLSVPLLVGALQAERRWLLGDRPEARLHVAQLVGLTLAIAVVGEEVFPRLDALRQTRDVWDYLAYGLGGLVTWLATRQ